MGIYIHIYLERERKRERERDLVRGERERERCTHTYICIWYGEIYISNLYYWISIYIKRERLRFLFKRTLHLT